MRLQQINDQDILKHLHSGFFQGFLRLFRSTLALGDIVGAEGVLQAYKATSAAFTSVFAEEERRLEMLKKWNRDKDSCLAKENKDFRRVRGCVELISVSGYKQNLIRCYFISFSIVASKVSLSLKEIYS